MKWSYGRFTLICALMALVAVSHARAEDVRVLGLFSGKAVLTINGERRVMAVGETSPEGYTLLDANSNEATLKIDGKRQTFALSDPTSLRFAPPVETVLKLKADRGGMFTVQGHINNVPMDFLVDTGASSVALNRNQAGRLGIDYKRTGRKMMMSTASGEAAGYVVTLATVKVGPIELKNIEAVISDNDFPQDALLGMTFLSKLEMNRSADTMTLKKK